MHVRSSNLTAFALDDVENGSVEHIMGRGNPDDSDEEMDTVEGGQLAIPNKDGWLRRSRSCSGVRRGAEGYE